MRRACVTVLILTSTIVCSLSKAQTITVDVLLQQIVATVTDSQGRFVTNLKPEDFVVEVDGRPQTIEHFAQDADTPVSLGFVLDTSTSMKTAMTAAIDSATMFIHELRPTDQALLLTFDREVHVQQDLTQDLTRVTQAMTKVRANPQSGGTNVLGGVAKASERIRYAKNKKRALIVISDGGENIHTMEFEKFMSIVRNSETVYYAIQLDAPKIRPPNFPTFTRTACTPGLEPAESRQRAAPSISQSGPLPEQRCNALQVAVERYFDWVNRALHYFHLDLSMWSPAELTAYEYDRVHYDAGVNPVEDRLHRLMMQGISAETGGRYFLVEATDSPDALSQRLRSVATAILTDLRSQYTLGVYPSSPVSNLSRVRVRMVNPEFKVRTRFESGEMRQPE